MSAQKKKKKEKLKYFKSEMEARDKGGVILPDNEHVDKQPRTHKAEKTNISRKQFLFKNS